MLEQTLSEQLSREIAQLQFDRIPAHVIDAAKLHILDSLGCILAGTRLEPGRLAYNLAVEASVGNANSTLFGTARRAGYLDAVQAMATAAHCGELDDIHGGAATCIGAMIVPALLALAERHGASGRRFLEAAIAGYETTARIGLSIDAPKLFDRGWWPSTVCGAFGVAAAGAKFLGWPVDKTINAFGIASLHTGGMLTGGQEGATARHLAFGSAARNGLLALLATEQGLTGPKRALEDPRGFCFTLCAEPKLEFLQDFKQFHLLDVAFKPYPCARQLHAGVEALLKLTSEYSIGAEAIRAIELAVPTQNAGMVDRPATPTLRAATLGSGQYVMAVTAFRGKIDLASFEDEFLQSEPVRQLMTKVTVSASTELDRHFPKYWAGRVTVTLADGQVHTQEIIAPKGEIENPLTPQDVEAKFLGLAGPVLGEGKARAVIDEVSLLDTRDSMAPLLAALKLSE
ncbi:MAG TPA: MmgE/PrpD family protein [Candidatus Deferrimicrobium sp.]|nr:MmgE/PrpD family protein [Candidatus Deferrimicrobium sp.]